MRTCKFTVALLALLWGARAQASTEINGLFDARSAGMAGTGVAFLDSAAAVPTNPALLEQIHTFTTTLDLFYIVSQPEAPYSVYHRNASGQVYASYDTIQSSLTGAVLPFLGAAYRLPFLDKRLVLGLAAYPIIGQGTSAVYHPAPDALPNLEIVNKASLGFIEIGEALSARILDNLSVGATWRITYMTQSVTTALPNGNPPAGNPPAGIFINPTTHDPVYANIDVHGLNFGGYELGVLYKPFSQLRLGFNYRSKVVVNGTGKTNTQNPVSGAPLSLDTKTSFTYPHAFRGGLAVTLFDDRLLLAAEFKYLMYAEAFKTLATTTVQAGVARTDDRPLYWKDSVNVLLGAEYRIGTIYRVRAGYTLVTSATPDAYAVQFMAPPGVSHLGTVGFGVQLFDHLNLDASAGYVVLAKHIDTPTVNNSGIGEYASHGGEFSLGATYHM